jgi:hypothetical protein
LWRFDSHTLCLKYTNTTIMSYFYFSVFWHIPVYRANLWLFSVFFHGIFCKLFFYEFMAVRLYMFIPSSCLMVCFINVLDFIDNQLINVLCFCIQSNLRYMIQRYSQTCLLWPSKGKLKYGHIRQVVAKYRINKYEMHCEGK